jgi:hypothetical protein
MNPNESKPVPSTPPIDRLWTAAELAARLNLHEDTVRAKSQGRRPEIPVVRIGRKVSYDWRTVAAKLGIAVSLLILLSPTTPAASPTFPEPAASPASRSAAGAPLSVTMRAPAGANGGAGGNTTAASLSSPHREFDGQVKGHSTVLSPISPRPGWAMTRDNAQALRASRDVSLVKLGSGAAPAAGHPFSAMRRDPSGGIPKPRVGKGTGGIPSWLSPTGGSSPDNLGPVTPPAPPSFPAGGGRWYGIDLDKLAHAESRSRDGAVGASGERGRLQITRAALADVNRRRRSKVRFSTLTNAATSVSVARDYIEILAGRIRRSGHEPSPAAILCAWNDGFADARRYGFDPDRAPFPTRRLIAAQ